MTDFHFELLAGEGAARRGRVHTAHGQIDTPAFMPVGTAATVKAMLPQSVAQSGAQILLANTYHLMLQPGAERIQKLGGLHRFMDWPAPILTDSGGFQVMSLAALRKISEAGVAFKSHIDGSAHLLTPERSIEIQQQLGATISMAFDECPAYDATPAYVAESMRLSMRWAQRCRDAFTPRQGYALFGIVQGGVYAELRAESIEALLPLDFHGLAIGGLAVGEGQRLMLETVAVTAPRLPASKPRYLMGVGHPDDLVGAVARGVDLFDCVVPTRSGRNAKGWTARGAINLRNARHRDDPRPIEADCSCPACRQFSRAYLHHLFRRNEMLGPMLLTWHNLTYYQRLMAEMRDAIAAQRFAAWQTDFAARYAEGDLEPL